MKYSHFKLTGVSNYDAASMTCTKSSRSGLLQGLCRTDAATYDEIRPKNRIASEFLAGLSNKYGKKTVGKSDYTSWDTAAPSGTDGTVIFCVINSNKDFNSSLLWRFESSGMIGRFDWWHLPALQRIVTSSTAGSSNPRRLFSETIYQSTQCNISEDLNLHRCENLKSRNVVLQLYCHPLTTVDR